MLVEGLFAVLSADASLQALLGTPATRSDNSTGLYPVFAPDELPMPYVVYQQVGGEPVSTTYAGTDSLQSARWRFSCYGSTYKNAKELARVLKQVLLSLNGVLPGTPTKAEVRGSWLRLEADEAEPIPHGTIFTCHLDFEFVYYDNDV